MGGGGREQEERKENKLWFVYKITQKSRAGSSQLDALQARFLCLLRYGFTDTVNFLSDSPDLALGLFVSNPCV